MLRKAETGREAATRMRVGPGALPPAHRVGAGDPPSARFKALPVLDGGRGGPEGAALQRPSYGRARVEPVPVLGTEKQGQTGGGGHEALRGARTVWAFPSRESPYTYLYPSARKGS